MHTSLYAEELRMRAVMAERLAQAERQRELRLARQRRTLSLSPRPVFPRPRLLFSRLTAALLTTRA